MTTITTRLIGGLGNQMFQYAAARALALRRGAEVRIDLSGLANPEIYTRRDFELGPFPIAASIVEFGDTARHATTAIASDSTWFARRLGRRPGTAGPSASSNANATCHAAQYWEAHFQFDPGLDAQPLPLTIEGYWQSERYFADAADTIRAEFTPSAPLEPENAAIAAQIERVEAVSIHVRRGDYVSNATTAAVHGTCSLEYYRAAIDFVRERAGTPHLFVFSDDQDWTRGNLKSDLPTTYVSTNPPDRGFRDMQLMSRCRHHIIANSSFSWWGAWLNPRAEKTVVAPARWFASGTLDTRDLLPDRWVRL